MTSQIFISNIVRLGSSLAPQVQYLNRLDPENETSFVPDIYIERASSVTDAVSNLVFEAVSSANSAISSYETPAISYNYPSGAEPSLSIGQAFANALETPLPSIDQITNLPNPIHLFENLSVSAPSLSTFLAPGGDPGGDPGSVPPGFADNITFNPPLKKMSIKAFSSAAELVDGTDFLKGFSYALLGVAALATTFFLGKAVYRGYKRYQSLSASRSVSQQRKQRVQELIERQALIDKRFFKERFKSRPRAL